jgi:hypothetical protein
MSGLATSSGPDDLVERLKDDAVPSGGRWQLRRDAAAELTRLRARIAELEAENARFKQMLKIALDQDDEPSAGDFECTR